MYPLHNASIKKAPRDDLLAWTLVAAHPHLSRAEGDRVYIDIGVGETFAAIEALLHAIARDGVPLADDLVTTVTSWLDFYRGQVAEPRLRRIVAHIRRTSPEPTAEIVQLFRSASDPPTCDRRSVVFT